MSHHTERAVGAVSAEVTSGYGLASGADIGIVRCWMEVTAGGVSVTRTGGSVAGASVGVLGPGMLHPCINVMKKTSNTP